MWGDGTVLGTTKIVNNGLDTKRWNLVIVSEGYQASEMATFATDAQNVVNDLFATAPFNEVKLFNTYSTAINVHRVDVTSTDSGADDPAGCAGGTGATAATFFDASFCNSGIRRLLLVDTASVVSTVSGLVPNWHAILVIVNSPIYGGAGGTIGTFAKAPGANEIAIHELGHTAFGLADEYEYWAGCGVDTNRDNHPAVEPGEPNVTIDSNPATNKWGSFIDPMTPVPTTQNADCSACDPQPSPVPAGTVGAFEGAHYYHCDAYRPEFNCKMRSLHQPFCAVCRARIRSTLAPFMPNQIFPGRFVWELEKLLYVLKEKIDLVADPIPFDLMRYRDVVRRGRSQEFEHALERTKELEQLGRRSAADLADPDPVAHLRAAIEGGEAARAAILMRAARVLLVGYEDQDNLGLRYLSGSLRRAGHDTRIVAIGGRLRSPDCGDPRLPTGRRRLLSDLPVPGARLRADVPRAARRRRGSAFHRRRSLRVLRVGGAPRRDSRARQRGALRGRRHPDRAGRMRARSVAGLARGRWSGLARTGRLHAQSGPSRSRGSRPAALARPRGHRLLGPGPADRLGARRPRLPLALLLLLDHHLLRRERHQGPPPARPDAGGRRAGVPAHRARRARDPVAGRRLPGRRPRGGALGPRHRARVRPARPRPRLALEDLVPLG